MPRVAAPGGGAGWRGTTAVPILSLALVIAGSAPAAGSQAEPAASPTGRSTEIAPDGGDLVLRAEAPSMDLSALTPGDRAAWVLQTHLEGAPAGTLHLRLSGSGDLVDHAHGLEVSVRTCSEPFASSVPGAECPGENREVVQRTRLAEIVSIPAGGAPSQEPVAGPVWALADLVSGAPRHVMVTLGIPAEAAHDRSLQGLTGRAGVGLYAAGAHAEQTGPPPGDSNSPTPPAPEDEGLASTGTDAARWLSAAVLLVVLGTLAVRSARRRRRST